MRVRPPRFRSFGPGRARITPPLPYWRYTEKELNDAGDLGKNFKNYLNELFNFKVTGLLGTEHGNFVSLTTDFNVAFTRAPLLHRGAKGLKVLSPTVRGV